MMFSNDLLAKVRVRHEGTFENPDNSNKLVCRACSTTDDGVDLPSLRRLVLLSVLPGNTPIKN
jgi:hypothetical protein